MNKYKMNFHSLAVAILLALSQSHGGKIPEENQLPYPVEAEEMREDTNDGVYATKSNSEKIIKKGWAADY